jgi:hypothetical protein
VHGLKDTKEWNVLSCTLFHKHINCLPPANVFLDFLKQLASIENNDCFFTPMLFVLMFKYFVHSIHVGNTNRHWIVQISSHSLKCARPL